MAQQDRCKQCGCTREDLLHHLDELVEREVKAGMERGTFSKDCHDFVEETEASNG